MTNGLTPISMDKVNVFCLKLSLNETLGLPIHTALSADELQRVDRFAHHEDRLRFIAGRLILRHLLAFELEIRPQEVELELVAGKPALASKQFSKVNIQFSISHSGEMVMLAIRHALPIGVDIERIRPKHKVILIAKRVMNDKEFHEFSQLDQHQQKNAFFRLWADKEAILKYWGSGFKIAPATIDIGITLERDKQWFCVDHLPDLTLTGGHIKGDENDYMWTVATSKQAIKNPVILTYLDINFLQYR